MKSLTIRLYYVFSDFLGGTLVIYLPYYLKNHFDYDGGQIGTILFFGGAFAIIGLLIAPRIINIFRYEKSALIVEFLLMLVALLLIITQTNFYLIVAAVSLAFLSRMAIYSIGDNITSEIGKKQGIDFGKIRSFGSIGWGLSFLINGYVIGNHSELFIYVWLTAIILATINLILIKEEKKDYKVESIMKLSTLKEILKHLDARKFLVFAVFSYSIMQTQPVFINFFIDEIGGSVEILSYFAASFVVLEFIGMFFALEVRRKFQDSKYVEIVLLLIILKSVIIALTNDPTIVYLSAIIDPIAFGLTLPINTSYLKETVPKKYGTTILSIYGIASLMFIAIFSKVFGNIMDYADTRTVFYILSIISVIVLVVLRFLKISDYSKK